MLLIDDADAVDDPARALSDLFSAPLTQPARGRRRPRRRAADARALERRRPALAHRAAAPPDVQVDGALLGVTLPRRPAPPVRPGCGYRVDPGGFELVQVAHARPDPA